MVFGLFFCLASLISLLVSTKHKYEIGRANDVLKQIDHALEKLESSSKQNQEKIKAILKRYAAGEIGLDETYYELLEDELIPMPQRCTMSAKVPTTADDEQKLKEKIKRSLSI
jgi:predicted  nucleic acid-binding Zn-ribbon protein